MWYREIRKRGLLPLTLFVLSASIAEPFGAAQTRVETLEEMGAQLSPGQRVTLVKTNGESMIGRFTRLDERSVELSVDVDVASQQRRRTDLVVMRDAIQSLERKKDSSSEGRLRFHTMPLLTRNTRGFSITVSY